MTTLAAADAQWIARRWPDLLQYRYPGTPRPWHQPPPRTPGQHTPTPADPLPNAPAPLDLDTHDLITRILAHTHALATAHAADTGNPPPPAAATPGPHLTYILATHTLVTGPVAEHTTHVLHKIRARMTEHFAERPDGQYLRADCPWCHRHGLRIRLIPEPVVLCEHPGCNPATSQCGTWWHGHPAWPLHEWEWLNTNMTA